MIQYKLTRRRRMKNLRLRVKEDGSVHVSAPYGVSAAVIDEFVQSREGWINEQRGKLTANAQKPKTELCDGDVVTILGREYVVTAVEGTGGAFAEGGMLVIPVSDIDDTAELEEKALVYMAGECRRVCTKSVEAYLKRAEYSGAPVKLKFKLMKSRWGSYNRRDNVITFNLALCKLPEKYVNYVAAHEVTHIFVQNHSDDFYKAGEQIFEGFLITDRQLNRIKIGGIFS